MKGHIDCNTSNVIDQLKCSICPEDFIGTTITPLRIRMNNLRFDIVHTNSAIPLSSYASHHKNKKNEDSFELKEMYHEEPTAEDNLYLSKIEILK